MDTTYSSPARGRWFLFVSCFAALLFGAPRHAAACHNHHHDHHHQHGDDDDLEIVASFDASGLETPESVAIDSHNNVFVNLALTGEIRKIAKNGWQSTFAILPLGAPPATPCGPFVGGLTGLTIDHHDNLYVSLASCDESARGVWKIDRHGHTKQLATLPISSLPNGITYRGGKLYVADSSLGVIWRLSASTPGVAEAWLEDPLLAPCDPSMPGANGVQFYGDELYVSNSSLAEVFAIELSPNGYPSAIRSHAVGAFCDDFAFDVEGALYCGTDPFNTLVRFTQDGVMDVLLSADDGLDGTTAAIFGRSATDRRELYITNASFPFFPTSAGRPTLMKTHIGVRGAPRF